MLTLIEWCETWARARGYWTHSAHRRKGWCVRAIDAAHLPPGFQVCRGGDDGFDGWTSLTPVQMWLFAHAVDSERLDSQRCPDCTGTKRVDQHGDRIYPVAEGLEAGRPCPTCTGPAVDCEACDVKGGWQRASSWDGCRACDSMRTVPGPPLGYISRTLAHVLYEAMPHEVPPPKGWSVYMHGGCERDGVKVHRNGCVWVGAPDGSLERAAMSEAEARRLLVPADVYRWADGGHSSPGDPAARATLEAHADALQAEGNPLATALLLWLHGVPCENAACVDGRHPQGWPEPQWPICSTCRGDGTALMAYVAAQLEVDRLAQWRADCDALEFETMEDLAADFLDALAP